MTRDVWTSPDGRRLLARSLHGSGIELGPGSSPFEIGLPGLTITSVDQWGVEENRRLFPEVDPSAFREPDVRVDLNQERLSTFPDESQDFIVASHVLEHLVDPLGQLEDMHRVLRPGGILLLVLPDRRRTFDHTRPPTPLQHLVDEHAAGATRLDDAHIADFLTHIPDNDVAEDLAERYELHRQRSIHVHVWTDEEFADVLEHCIRHLRMQWELVDQMSTDDIPDGIEFGFALRKSTLPLDPEWGASRFHLASQGFFQQGRWRAARLRAAHEQIQAHQEQVTALSTALSAVDSELTQARRVLANHEKLLRPLRRLAGERVRRWIRRH